LLAGWGFFLQNLRNKTLLWNYHHFILISFNFISMKDSIQKRVEAIWKKAKEDNIPYKNIRTIGTSSLHQIIKTKEQAERFMKKLKEA
jgi:hypothetical protein